MTPTEAAAILRAPRWIIWRAMLRGDLEYTGAGLHRDISEEQFEAYIDRHTIGRRTTN